MANIPSLEEIEKLNKMAIEYRAIETVLDRVERAMREEHATVITHIAAHDSAGGHRDIEYEFCAEDARLIFEMIDSVMSPRLKALKEKLGME